MIKILLIALLPVVLLGAENNTTVSKYSLFPNAGLLYQKSLGPTATVGINYINNGLELAGPYGSVELGLYGQAYNVGIRGGNIILNVPKIEDLSKALS